jgi:hypothetical protein
MEKHFKAFTVEYIHRNKNTEADEVMKAAAHNNPLPVNVFLQTIKTIEPEPRVINIIRGEDWRAVIIAYLRHYYEPDSIVEQTRMQQRAQLY